MVRVALTSRAPKTDSGNTPTFGARPSISLIIESAIPLFKIGPKCPARLNGRLGLLWHIAAIHACPATEAAATTITASAPNPMSRPGRCFSNSCVMPFSRDA